MTRLALLLARMAVIFAVVAICLGSASLSAENDSSPTPSPSPAASPSPSPESTPEPAPDFNVPEPVVTPEPTPSPTPAPLHLGPLKEGDWVQVTGTDSCLNVRMQPSLAPAYPEGDPSTAIINCLPDGFVARLGRGIVGGGGGEVMPVNADGHWWWYLLGQGWAAEDWLAFHHEGGMPYPVRSELAAAGLIAFIGADQNLWVMNADGSGPRVIATRANEQQSFSQLQWAPLGNLLAFTVHSYDAAAPQALTRVIDPNGAVVAEYDRIVEAVWSPDGTKLSAIGYENYGDMGGYKGAPVVLDLATGVVTRIGASESYMAAAAWSPDGTQLAYTCVSWTSSEQQPDGTIKETRVDCGGDGVRLVTPDGVHARVLVPFDNSSAHFYGSPSWSPDGGTISLSSNPTSETGCRGYKTVDVASGALSGCIALPPWGGFGGRCGGSSEDGATDWSPDGRYLAYHSMYGAGTNGVYLRDLATGATKVVPSNQPSSISFSGDGAHLTFANAGYVWAVNPDGSGLALLGAGYSPAWQPR